jgi:CheY-like chemotaxis protein
MARVLIAAQDPASRLTLQTVLEAGGYRVDSAATAAEAVGLMDEKEYALVLTDLAMESPEAGLKVIAHARLQDYQPATALVAAWSNDQQEGGREQAATTKVLVQPQDVPELLGQVATLISRRATRLVARRMRRRQAAL